MPAMASACSWRLDLDRGPNWLFVRLSPSQQGCEGDELAEQVEHLLHQCLTTRLVLELDQVELLTSMLLGQFVQLDEHIRDRGGLVRLCGLSDNNQGVLRMTRLDDRLPNFRNREDAVQGYRPLQPR